MCVYVGESVYVRESVCVSYQSIHTHTHHHADTTRQTEVKALAPTKRKARQLCALEFLRAVQACYKRACVQTYTYMCVCVRCHAIRMSVYVFICDA